MYIYIYIYIYTTISYYNTLRFPSFRPTRRVPRSHGPCTSDELTRGRFNKVPLIIHEERETVAESSKTFVFTVWR